MQITTLGQLAVDGRPVRGDRLAAVVRELIGARGRAVSVAALVEAVWDGAPPEDAMGAMQALMSRVRRLGLPVSAVPGGYRVAADDVRVDAVEARTLAEQARAGLRSGDPATARRCADAARALFPEVPELLDTADCRLFADVAAVRAEAALAGAGSLDVTDLRRLVARTPPDEPSAALLVRVLAAQGREAEALEVVERLRAELAERYGTDPSSVVTQAHLALLRGELSPLPASPPVNGNEVDHVPVRREPGRASLPPGWRRPRTPLLGREDDVAAVLAALADAPLVTVVASGGAGKTRLATEVAQRTAAGRPVHVVELAGLRSADEVLPAVLAAIGAVDPAVRPESAARAPAERLSAVAHELEGLLVVDNCEHLLAAAAAVVADLLAVASPQLAVLATSRAPLGVLGEVVHRLPALPDAEAVALLAARARAGGAASIGDPDRALELCHRLDNLPLAIELAAARLRNMPVGDVLAGLADRFALLDDVLRGLPERHASLWAMVDWSHELLPVAARELLQRLSVVPSSFTAATAAAVAGGTDVRGSLATLVEQSLLTLDESADAVPRYRMLETVREYGEVRLDATGGREEAMSGLVSWARDLTVALAADFIGPDQLTAFGRCLAEQDNLVAALRWSIVRGDEAGAVDLAAALFRLWTVRGLHPEIIVWATMLLRQDDPVARRDSVILHGSALGRPLPDADRLAWLLLIITVNAGVANAARLLALGRQAVRALVPERAGEISHRPAMLLAALPVLDSTAVEPGLATAAAMIADADPYVQGFGYFMRAALREGHGLPSIAAGDGAEAYRRFEEVGDHWGMGMAAQGMGERVGGDGGVPADEWLRRGELHMGLIGAAQDVDQIRVKLDVRQALAGDREAANRLRALCASPDTEDLVAAQAHLGLAHLAWDEGRASEALAHTETVGTLAAGIAISWPQPRAVIRSAAAVLYLRMADSTGSPEAAARAVALLRLVGDETLSARDNAEIGTWALGGAALAAYRGDGETARSLWTAGLRQGPNIVFLFPRGQDERLTVLLGTEEDREPLLAAWRALSVTEASDRIRELMGELLAQTFLR